jgi:hypothetical protein
MDNPSDLIESIKTVKHFHNLGLNDLRLIVTAGPSTAYARARLFSPKASHVPGCSC